MNETNRHLLELWKSAESVAQEGKKAILYMPKKAILDKPASISYEGSLKLFTPGSPPAVKPKPPIILPTTMSLTFLVLTVALYLFSTPIWAFILSIPAVFFYIILIRAVWIRLKP